MRFPLCCCKFFFQFYFIHAKMLPERKGVNRLKTCPKCGTFNSETSDRCSRCKEPLPASDPPRKYCPQCQRVFPHTAQECDRCHIPLNSYSYIERQPDSGKVDKIPSWIYVILIIFPMLTLILSFVYVNRGWVKMGRRILTLSVIMVIAQSIGAFLLSTTL